MVKNIFRKSLVIGIIILFLGTSILPSISGGIGKNNEFQGKTLSIHGWKHRISLTIDTPTQEDNYQVKIEINPSVFDYSKVNTDGSDIRFFDTDGNKLSYWIEEWNLYGTSIIWVKVIKAGTETIEMYCGNNEAKSESNGDETFIFFDDFTNDNWWVKWEDYNVDVTVSNSEMNVTEKYNFEHGYLVSHSNIPIGTRIRFRLKNEKLEKNSNMFVGLYDDKDPISSPPSPHNYISVSEIPHQYYWIFTTFCNEEEEYWKDITDDPNWDDPNWFEYHVHEFLWEEGLVEYYWNDILVTNTSTNISEGEFYIWFRSSFKMSIFVDWVTVTKLNRGGYDEVIFFDDFNDDNLDEDKWDTYGEGDVNEVDETNQRLEILVYESGSQEAGVISSEFEVSLASDPIVISWDWDTCIGCTAYVGTIGFRLIDYYDESKWIEVAYVRNTKITYFKDYNDMGPTPLEYNKVDGLWNNEINLFSGKYSVRQDELSSTWVNNDVFDYNTKLIMKFFVYSHTIFPQGGSSTGFEKAAFDNVLVVKPKRNPFGLKILGNNEVKFGEKYNYIFTAADPENENLYFYIEWEDNSVGDWVGPVQSYVPVEVRHEWNTRGFNRLRARVIDTNGYESPWRVYTVKVNKKARELNSFYLLKTIYDKYPNLFPILRLFQR